MKISAKLRQKCGSSMILVLVFLLFCTFVGGSVLAVASANSARVKHLSEEQQQFLSQRSAVLLMKDAMMKEYRPTPSSELISPPNPKMLVDVVTTTVRPVKIMPNGGVVDDTTPGKFVKKTLSFAFEAEDNDGTASPAVQRLVYESAVLRILNRYNYNRNEDSVRLENFKFLTINGSDTVTLSNPDDFWLSEENNNLKITLTEGGDTLDDSVLAKVLCEGGDDPYHFWITFGDAETPAQASLKMDAMVSEKPGQQSGGAEYENEVTRDGIKYADEITTVTTTIAITWQIPEIVKGGVD